MRSESPPTTPRIQPMTGPSRCASASFRRIGRSPWRWGNRTRGNRVKTRLLLAAIAALVVVVVGSAGQAAADQGHQTKYATITKDCINSITGQDEGDITYTGPVEVWPPNHKYVS